MISRKMLGYAVVAALGAGLGTHAPPSPTVTANSPSVDRSSTNAQNTQLTSAEIRSMTQVQTSEPTNPLVVSEALRNLRRYPSSGNTLSQKGLRKRARQLRSFGL
jgi:hypothetical protein